MYTTIYSNLLTSFLRSTDQKKKTAEAIRHFIIPKLRQRDIFADLGCGSGEISESLVPFFQKSILADLDASNIRILQNRFAGKEHVSIYHEDLNTFVPPCQASMMLFSFSLGYLGSHLPEHERLNFRMEILNGYFSRLHPEGCLVIADTTNHGAYRYLFEFMNIPVHHEIGTVIEQLTGNHPFRQHEFEVTVRTASIEKMVQCLRLITYDDGTSNLNLVPRYLEFCQTLPREADDYIFRYSTVLTVIGHNEQ